MLLSEQGAEFIANFEGFRSLPYWDVDHYSIGYGTRSTKNAAAITRTEARERLRRHVNEHVKPTLDRLDLDGNQNRFDALASFAYNLGSGSLDAATGVGSALRAKEWLMAGDLMLEWDKAGGQVLPGLTRRREKERALFLRVAYTDDELTNLARLKQPGSNPAARAWLERQAVKIRTAAYQTDPHDWQTRDRGRRYQGIRRALRRYR